MSRIEALQRRYAQIEAEIGAMWPEKFVSGCSACTEICCRPHMADEVLHSFWLNELAVKAHGKNWHLDHHHTHCAALSDTGCLLKAGKPPFCFAFYCDSLLGSIPPVTLVSYLFLSLILSDLCRLDKRRNLQTMTAEEVYQSLDAVEAKIVNAERHLGIYRQFLDAETSSQPLLAIQMLAEIPQILSASARRTIMAALR